MFYESFLMENAAITLKNMEDKLMEVKHWMSANRLKMNDGKTELIYFGNKNVTDELQNSCIKVGDVEIQPSNKVKYLGSWLDCNMNMKHFIKEKCKIAKVGG